MSKVRLLAICAGFAAGLGVQSAIAASFICPVIHSPPAPAGVEPISGLMSGINNANENSRIGEAVSRLRASGMAPGLIVDHLVGAFCPIVAQTALNDEQKTDRVRLFARQVAMQVYGPSGQTETAILIDVPLKAGIVDEIDRAAHSANISRDAWIERSISHALRGKQ